MIRRLVRERALLIWGPAAAVMQVAHPLVAAGVANHSRFATAPLDRLHRTLEAVYAIAFGTNRQADGAAAGIGRMHARVRGELPPINSGATGRGTPRPVRFDATGRHGSAGTPTRGTETPIADAGRYSAADPDLVMWVTATLVAATVDPYRRVIGPLTDEEVESFYQDMRRFGAYFGLPPDHGPQTWPAFVAYYDAIVNDPRLGAHPVSREVAWAVATPRHPVWLRPAALPGRALLAETLPPVVAERLGFRRTRASRAAFAGMMRVLPALIPRLPRRLRYVPQSLPPT